MQVSAGGEDGEDLRCVDDAASASASSASIPSAAAIFAIVSVNLFRRSPSGRTMVDCAVPLKRIPKLVAASARPREMCLVGAFLGKDFFVSSSAIVVLLGYVLMLRHRLAALPAVYILVTNLAERRLG